MNEVLQLVFKYLPYLITASKSVPQVIGFISEIKAIFKRDKVWTPEEEAAFDEKVAHLKDDPAWVVND